MALILQSQDPTLWAQLNTLYQTDTSKQWVLYGGLNYKVTQMADGTIAFNSVTNRELYDSRSFRNSKSASYKKLDG